MTGVLRALGAACAIATMPAAVHGQVPSPDVAEGRRVFHQKCAVCHVANTVGEESYGPKLSKAQVERSEAAVKQIIAAGGLRMPGFQHTLQPQQIDAIVAFLRTLGTPSDRVLIKTPAP
jgi:mono/diheme cytochrome c family protein